MRFPIGRWLGVAALAFTAYAAALFFLQDGKLGQAWSLLLSQSGLFAALLARHSRAAKRPARDSSSDQACPSIPSCRKNSAAA